MNKEIDYQFWLNATLAAIPIALAVLAAVLTVAGIIGYRRIRAEAVRMARQEAKEAVDRLVQSGGLHSIVDERIMQEGDQVYQDLNLTREKVETGGPAGSVFGQITVTAQAEGTVTPQPPPEGRES